MGTDSGVYCVGITGVMKILNPCVKVYYYPEREIAVRR